MYSKHNQARRPRLTDILADRATDLQAQWNQTEAAPDFEPLPAGTYECRVSSGELFTSRQGTPGYKITFRVIDGKHAGRFVWHDAWLTAAALPHTKRDLSKLGITRLEQLETPLPADCIRCKVRVALRVGDDGTPYNRVRGFDVLGVDEPQGDAFAPADRFGGGGQPETPAAAEPQPDPFAPTAPPEASAGPVPVPATGVDKPAKPRPMPFDEAMRKLTQEMGVDNE